MRHFVAGAVLALTLPAASMVQATDTKPAAAKPAAPKYSTADTDIGTLLDNPVTKAIIEKNIPGMTANPQVDMARGMTLRAIQAYAADQVTDARLAAIDAELAKVTS